MTVAAAEMIWMGLGLYLAGGFVVALLFAIWGARTVDHGAVGAGVAFRLVIAPGIALLWPYMIARLISGRRINAPIDRGRDAGS